MARQENLRLTEPEKRIEMTIRQWKVPSETDGRKKYTVTQRGRNFLCSCAHWIHTVPRPICKHIAKREVTGQIVQVSL
jgi:hypothetical protein